MPRWTIYSEVTAEVDQSPCDDLLAKASRQLRAPLDELAEAGLTALREAVAEIPDGTYIMPFSGGYDSRLLLALIPARIQLIGITWEPERDAAALVADSVGACVGRDPFIRHIRHGGGWRDALLPLIAHGMRISDPWRWQGGRHLLPDVEGVAMRSPPVVGVISALWADETLGAFAAAKEPLMLGAWLARRCMDQHCPPIGRGRWWTPFASRPWLELLCLRYHLVEREPNTDAIRVADTFGPGDTVKRAMLRKIDPRLLDVVNPRFELAKRTRPPFNETLPCNMLSDELRRELYEASGVEAGAQVGPFPWLRQYSTAAIVAADRADGVEVA